MNEADLRFIYFLELCTNVCADIEECCRQRRFPCANVMLILVLAAGPILVIEPGTDGGAETEAGDRARLTLALILGLAPGLIQSL